MHDFKERLAWSMTQSHEPFWDAVYRKAFPNLSNHMPCLTDTPSQRMGIDRIIHLGNGLTLAVDEKKRDKDYRDFFLELVSNDKTGALGWIEKDLAIDYLAYAFMPSKRCYLFPWPMLRRAWLHYKPEWTKKYKPLPVPNNGYNTIGIAVPIAVVCNAVQQAQIIDVSFATNEN